MERFTYPIYKCPSTPPWRGAQLKHKENFTFTFTFTFIYGHRRLNTLCIFCTVSHTCDRYDVTIRDVKM